MRSRSASPYPILIPLLALSIVASTWLGTDASRNSIIGYLHIFVSGLLISSLTAKGLGKWQGHSGWLVVLLGGLYAVAFLAIPWIYDPRWVYIDLPTILLCDALLAATILGGNCWANHQLSISVFMWLGEVSFGIYLLHRPASWLVDLAMGDFSRWISLPFKILLTLLLAQIAYKLLEGPSRSLIRRSLTRNAI